MHKLRERMIRYLSFFGTIKLGSGFTCDEPGQLLTTSIKTTSNKEDEFKSNVTKKYLLVGYNLVFELDGIYINKETPEYKLRSIDTGETISLSENLFKLLFEGIPYAKTR